MIAHNPGDMTVAVRAGTPLRALAGELAPHGQHVAFDAARVAAGATVGGLFATADAGPGALVYGSLRDLVIGMTVVLADGTVARSGGHVIKNVAGYDLAKLLHGSYGTLGVLAEVVLRLHPVPKASATVAVRLPAGRGRRAGRHGARRPPRARRPGVDHGDRRRLLVRLEGTEAPPGRLRRPRTGAAPRGRSGAGRTRPRRGVRTAASGRGTRRSPAARPGRRAVLRIGVRPTRLPACWPRCRRTAVTAGLGTGIATVTLRAGAVADAHAPCTPPAAPRSLRARPAGATRPRGARRRRRSPVLTALKAELDPDGRFGPGRFAPWM